MTEQDLRDIMRQLRANTISENYAFSRAMAFAAARAEAAEARASALAARVEGLVEVVEAARDLVMKPGGLANRGVDRGLVVVERADNSDPHYRLCDAFKRLDALSADAALNGGAGK